MVRRSKKSVAPHSLQKHLNRAIAAMNVYEVRPRQDRRGVELTSDTLPFGSAVVCRIKRNQQSNRLRDASSRSHWWFKNKERVSIRFNLTTQSTTHPIASATNGGVIILVA